MELFKICPACRTENHISEVMCCHCMTNISSVTPTPKAAPIPESKMGASLYSAETGESIELRDGEELGRNGENEAIFARFPTVSRHHARVTHHQEGWQLEDLNSTNGTWLNGARLQPNTPSPIKNGDVLQLSRSCTLEVRL